MSKFMKKKMKGKIYNPHPSFKLANAAVLSGGHVVAAAEHSSRRKNFYHVHCACSRHGAQTWGELFIDRGCDIL